MEKRIHTMTRGTVQVVGLTGWITTTLAAVAAGVFVPYVADSGAGTATGTSMATAGHDVHVSMSVSINSEVEQARARLQTR
jgi:hypothetical protein